MSVRKIEVDRKVCIGSGLCVLSLASVFELDEKRVSTLKIKDGKSVSGPVDRRKIANTEATDSEILSTAQACPVKAIRLFDEDGILIPL